MDQEADESDHQHHDQRERDRGRTRSAGGSPPTSIQVHKHLRVSVARRRARQKLHADQEDSAERPIEPTPIARHALCDNPRPKSASTKVLANGIAGISHKQLQHQSASHLAGRIGIQRLELVVKLQHQSQDPRRPPPPPWPE